MPETTQLILSSRAATYAQLVAASLPDLPLLATADPLQAQAEGGHCPIALADPGLVR